MWKKQLTFVLSLILGGSLFGVLVGGCASTTTAPPSPADTGTLEIRATDAPPTGVSSIMVTTENIEVHKADAPEDSWVTHSRRRENL